MKKLIWLLGLTLFCSASAVGQSTTVSLSVTDTPDSQTWNNGTYQTFFVGAQTPSWPGGAITLTSAVTALSATGTASFSLPDNATILPSGTQWRIQVCAATLPVRCFSQTQTITGASQTVALTPPSPRFTVPTIPQGGLTPLTAYANSEIVGGWVGFQYTNIGGASPAIQICTVVIGASCTTWAAAGGSTSPSTLTYIDAKNSGVKANAIQIWDAAFTNNSNVATCPNSDCNFTAANLGQITWGTNPSTQFVAQGTLVIAQGFICAVTAQSVTIGTTFPGCAADNANATCAQAGSQACLLVFGSDDSAALTTFWNVVTASSTCAPGLLPSGDMIDQTAQFNTNAANGPCLLGASNTLEGPSLLGNTTMTGTTILPTPNFSSASCTGGVNANGCFLSSQAIVVRELSIFGSGLGAIGAGFNGKAAVYPNGGSSGPVSFSNAFFTDVVLTGWGGTTNGFIGLQTDHTSATYLTNVQVIGMGQVNCQYNDDGVAGGFVIAYSVSCVSGGASGSALAVGLNLATTTHLQYWISTSGYYGNLINTSSAASVSVNVGSGQTYIGTGDQIVAASVGSTNWLGLQMVASTSTAYLDNSVIYGTENAGTGAARGINFAAGTLHLARTQITASGTGAVSVFMVSGGKLIDEGGNTFNSTAANTVAANTIYGVTSFIGAIPVTGNFALTNATFTSVTGNDQKHFTLNITASAAAVVTVVYTFPTTPGNSFAGFLAAPGSCHAQQIGGTQPNLTFNTTVGPSATAVTFASTANATNTNTLNVAVDCA